MKLDKFTQKSQEAIFQAQEIARDYNHQSIEPAHLLLALIRQDQGVVPAIVTRVAGSVQALRDELQNELSRRPRIQGAGMEVGLAQTTADTLTAAERYAKGMQDDYVSTEHILLALTDTLEGRRLASFGLTKDAILTGLIAWADSSNTSWQWIVIAGAFAVTFLTMVYTFRMIWKVFFGQETKTIWIQGN